MDCRQSSSPVTYTLAIPAATLSVPYIAATLVVGREPRVKIEEQALDAIPADPTFAPFSVNIYEFPVK